MVSARAITVTTSCRCMTRWTGGSWSRRRPP
jgi:hypothetical protein